MFRKRKLDMNSQKHGTTRQGLYGKKLWASVGVWDACGPLNLSWEASKKRTIYLLALRSLLRKAPGLVNGVLPCTAPGCLAE